MLLSTGLFDEHLSELDVWLTMLARVKAKDLILSLLERSLFQVRVCDTAQNFCCERRKRIALICGSLGDDYRWLNYE